jgi:hypothetical protein
VQPPACWQSAGCKAAAAAAVIGGVVEFGVDCKQREECATSLPACWDC